MSNYQNLYKNLEELKLNQIKLNIDKYIEKINNNEIGVLEALNELTTKEIEVKNYNARNAMVKVAGFPHLKEFKDFEFEFQPKINKQQFLDFESLRFLENNSNIMLIGNSGVGKTHLATSIGIAAAKKRISTYFIKCQDLIEQLRKAYIEHKLESRIKHFSKYKLLIIDEIGYLPIGEHEAKMFFQLIDRRYECKSTIITSNINLSDWDKIFLDKLLASAILDRLIHHSTIVNISGKSYRTAMALSNISESKKQETCT
ncbi:MAG: ATP-binding protein [Mollicutes bacterium]|nr:ATP-binding protein [Mollicutes bacterium]